MYGLLDGLANKIWAVSKDGEKLAGINWTGLDWTCLVIQIHSCFYSIMLIVIYFGLDWIGLDWTGLDWTGLDWVVV